jgi:large subunit ribosomal protein L17
MRHKRHTQNLSRFSSYFKATIQSLTRAVIINQKIVTTKVRAKLARRHVDRLITLGKNIDSLAARRRAFAVLGDHGLVKKLFSEIAPMFAKIEGGYTRIIPYKRRRGDNAELVVLELSKQKVIAHSVPEKKESKKAESDIVKAGLKEKKERASEQAQEASSKEGQKVVAPPQKDKHKKDKDNKKPSRQILGGFGKMFKAERDSL